MPTVRVGKSSRQGSELFHRREVVPSLTLVIWDVGRLGLELAANWQTARQETNTALSRFRIILSLTVGLPECAP